MKRFKKLCGAVLIAGFMLPQIALGGNSTAEAASGKWKQNGKKWWYSYSDGTYPKNKWEKIDGKWYHFDKSGYMQKGWQKISGKWYYFGTNGIMKKGWQKIGKKWYYFANGVMTTGWKKLSGKWYYFNKDGSMVTGKKTIGGKEYTFDSNGVMKEDTSTSSDTKSYADAKVGDIIKFGKYEQDNNKSNGKEEIEWLVIDKADDGSFIALISKYALDCKPFNSGGGNTNWKECSLRKWLNENFYNDAFSSAEQDRLIPVTIDYDSDETVTHDKVFLLCIDEAMTLLPNDEHSDYLDAPSKTRACEPTAYAIAQGAYMPTTISKQYAGEWWGNNCWWYLRSPGADPTLAALVMVDGAITGGGFETDRQGHAAVRPAIIITP